MFRFRPLTTAIPLVLALTLLPAAALAHGPAPKGQVLTKPVIVTGVTGEGKCQDQWYTVGFRPGQAAIDIAITGTEGMVRVPTIAIRSILYRGTTIVDSGQAACATKSKICRAVIRFRRRFSDTGVYYLYIHGVGANTIDFSARFTGNIYALHCKKFC